MSALLYLDGESLSVWFWRWGKLTPGPSFAADDSGPCDFSRWLALHRDDHFTLVADIVDEAFLLETIPLASRSDRRAMIARKLEQLFFGSPCRCAISLGREHDGRRDERMLFAAFPCPSPVETWMKALRDSDALFVALLTSAQLAAPLLPKALREKPHLLLAGLTPAGIRQTFFETGRLRFSRLATLTDGEDWIARLPYEVRKTQQYLIAQRALARGDAIPVALLATQDDLKALSRVCTDDEMLNYVGLDLAERLRAAGLPEATTSSALPLLLRQAARSSRAPQFAPEADRASFRWQRKRRAALAAGFAALAAGLAFAAGILLDAQALEEAGATQRRGTEAIQLHLDRELADLAKQPASPKALRAAIDQLGHYEARAGELKSALLQASHALAREQTVVLQKLEWSLQSEREGSEMILTAELDGPVANHAERLSALENLSESLRRYGASDVGVQKPSIDAEPGRSEAERFSLHARYGLEAR